ncbi:ABC transporter substrate-binding protein [Thermodesulfobacteriota bacterium]
MKKRTFILSLFLVGAFCLVTSNVWAAGVRGVTDTEIKLAYLTDFSGPGKFAGPAMALGADVYFKHINAQGSIHGRKIKLITEDNGIFPNTTLAAAKKVIFKDEIFSIVMNLGSSGSSAILPLCEENKVVLMPHGANKRFYNPGNKWVFVPYCTQYNMGARAVEYILLKNPKARMGMIYQDDDFGRDGLNGARDAAKFMKTKLVKEAPYKMGTVDMSPQVRMMKEANVDYIIMWTYIPQTGSVMKEVKKMGWNVKLIGNNTNAYRLLFALVGDLVDGYLAITPLVPWEDINPAVKDIFKKYGALEKLDKFPYPAVLALASFMYGGAMLEGIKNAGRNLTPETLVKGLENIKDLDIFGMAPKFTFTPKRHAAFYSSLVLRADAKKKRWVIEDPVRPLKTPQD